MVVSWGALWGGKGKAQGRATANQPVRLRKTWLPSRVWRICHAALALSLNARDVLISFVTQRKRRSENTKSMNARKGLQETSES